MKRITLIYDNDALSGDEASRDVLDQMDAIESALHDSEFTVDRLGADLQLDNFKQSLFSSSPDLVFNLVESLDGSDRLQTIITMLLEDWGLRFTGCGSTAMMTSNHKIETKRRLFAAGLPTAPCVWVDRSGTIHTLPEAAFSSGSTDWIIKSVESHASLFMDDSSVMRQATLEQLATRLRDESDTHGQLFFAEQFVDGREFNSSVLEGHGGCPVVLPPAEISFDSLPPEKPRIVGYAAKWNEESEEYRETPRSFSFQKSDMPLLARLENLSRLVWSTLDLGGYARVDFRIRGDNAPYILEVNTNPCLSPDAGFAAAAVRGGLDFSELIRRIIEVALK